ncbi:MAG TPA: hypothetical protein VG013_11065 [Gemmataceae bacterium]|nr:hypothetical protein [Gemmataceae bacterium]
MRSQTHTQAYDAFGQHQSCSRHPGQSHSSASRDQAEAMLRDVAHVLHLTRRLKADILAPEKRGDAVLA